MAADDHDLYNDDLYADLEDLDATQLEEVLEDPDEPRPAAPPAVPPASGNAPQVYNQATNASAAAPSAPAPAAITGVHYAQHDGGQHAEGSGGLLGTDRIKPNDMPDEGKMFIGGLNWETTDDGLKAYMSKYGDVEACTIMRDVTGRSRGFAFLTYSNPASVNMVMSATHHLDGKQIDPKRAIPRAEHEKTAKVFVGGLAPAVTSESLKVFLSQFGQVMDATVMYDRETTRSKGFAFATFADEEAVGIAMAASGIELEGKPIEIKKAQPRGSGSLPNKFSAPQGGRFGQGGGGNMGGGMGFAGAGAGAGAGFDPNAMAMMYQNMMKTSGMGNMGMGGGFDPNMMAMMYQNMMKNMGGMGNAPAINPNMARNMIGNGMGGMGMGNVMGMGNMGLMGNAMGGMGMGNMGNMGMGFNNGMAAGASSGRPMPNAPRGPAAMRSGPANATGMATPMSQNPGAAQGPGAQRYSTQGASRARPY